MTQKGCSGNCEQGRKICPTPMSCEIPEPDSISFIYLTIPVLVVSIIACLFIIWSLL